MVRVHERGGPYNYSLLPDDCRGSVLDVIGGPVWIAFGFETFVDGVSPFPKCDLKMMRLKKLLVSFLKSFLLGFPGFGT